MTEVSVQPKRTFWHDELKTRRSKPFAVASGTAHELKALGLVEIVDGETEKLKAKSKSEVEADIGPGVKPDEAEATGRAATPAKRGSRSNAVDKDA